MKLLILLLSALALLVSTPIHASQTIEFDGESYTKQFENTIGQDRVIEYVREQEDLKNWTKLLSIRHFPKIPDPRSAVVMLAKVVRAQNPQAQVQSMVNKDGADAVIDFLTWPPSGGYMEFNVFRYLKVEGKPGLVAYQFAHRFQPSKDKEVIDAFRKNRLKWMDLLIKANFGYPFPE